MKFKIMILLLSTMSIINGFSQETQTNEIKKVIADYIFVKNFLFNENSDSARIYAKDLYNSIAKVKTAGMPPKEKKAWIQFSEKISYDSEHIKGTNNIDHQREHFITLSANMYKMLKSFNLENNLYYEYCPMANDSKGAYWLSSSKEIENPYLGGKMPSCGSVKDSLISQQKSK